MAQLFDWFSFSRLFPSSGSSTADGASTSSSSSTSANSTKTKSKTDFEAREEWQKRKSQMMAVGLAVTAMIAYAFAIGLIRIDIVKTDLEYIEKR